MTSTSGSCSKSSYDPYARPMPRSLAASLALFSSRDAMATTSELWLACVAGITRSTAMCAVPSTPQRTRGRSSPVRMDQCANVGGVDLADAIHLRLRQRWKVGGAQIVLDLL